MKKAVIAFVVLGIVGAGGYGVYHHFFENTENSGRVSSTSEDAVYVDQVSAITGFGSGNGLVQRYGGEVEPQETLEVKLESDRTVKQCFVKEGDDVKTGQRLFVYDTQDDEDKLAQAQIDIEKAQGDIEVSKKQIASYEKAKANASSDEQLEYTTNIMTAQTAIKQSEYEIKTKELEVSNLKKKIADATVTSELDGVVQKISDTSDNSNSYYGSGSDSNAYITILSAGDYRIKGSVNEQNLQDLQDLYNMGATIIVHSRVDDSKTWKGTISEIKTDKAEENDNNSYNYSSSGNADSSSYAFYVELENSDDLILGQHVYMEEDTGDEEQKDGLWLEDYYIMQEDDGKAYVWMADKNNQLTKQEVTLGDYDEDEMKYEITDGLTEDDYITVPQDGIQEGAPVIYNDASEDTSSMDGSWSDGSDEMDGSWSDGSDEMDGSWSDGSDEMDGSWSDVSDDMDADYSDGDAGDGMVYDADQGSYVEDGEQ